MHEKGVVHRDMNPTNVFIDEQKDDLIKVLDFNVSKLIKDFNLEDESKASSKFKYSLFTKTGTPLYTAPEMQFAARYT
jgi:serine/threonine protein kinase